MLLAALIAAGLLIVVAVVGRVVTPQAILVDFPHKNLAPSVAHLFGTDWMGRDMLMRTLSALSTSLFVGLGAASASSLIAFLLACVSALGGRVADTVVTWLIDLVMGLPHIVLLILISYALGKGFTGVVVGVALTHWPSLARVLRAEILQARERPSVAVARALGAGPLDIALRHMVPAILPQFLVGMVLLFPHAILHEASITFLGFGLSPDVPAIGVILSEAMGHLSAGMWWLALFPGLALVLAVALFDRMGSLLRRLVDARTVQE
ncbi:ABC transporter permease [Collinsella sp. AGMB00827]|uniref:ABC transporter permease n=2 Tax=Collinsella ureilytica TaxID=2869515 RepID=A0ABS7MHM1_9ACTN|nr:ABC transporter permease [Collinsella urealyticum]MBY4796854.1 ABC transporter permease [Collinsella urealyticum]